MIRGFLAVVGSTLLFASVASGAAPLIARDPVTTDGWLRYARAVGRVVLLAPTTSEPLGLVLLGMGFVLVANQIRQKR